MTGLGTTSTGWVSTFRLSHFRGRVIDGSVPIAVCLNGGVHPKVLR